MAQDQCYGCCALSILPLVFISIFVGGFFSLSSRYVPFDCDFVTLTLLRVVKLDSLSTITIPNTRLNKL